MVADVDPVLVELAEAPPVPLSPPVPPPPEPEVEPPVSSPQAGTIAMAARPSATAAAVRGMEPERGRAAPQAGHAGSEARTWQAHEGQATSEGAMPACSNDSGARRKRVA